MAELPSSPEGIVLTHFIVSDDVERSRRFYTEVLGGTVVLRPPGAPCGSSAGVRFDTGGQAEGVPAAAAGSWPRAVSLGT
jgi:catechol 2,3-dioxygenase-like lactoylglutathione lyase family enzyme